MNFKNEITFSTKMSLINRILSMCESHAFMRPIIINSAIDHLKYGATGELLCQNIRNEWLYSNVTSRDESVFQFCNIDQKTYCNDIPSKTNNIYLLYNLMCFMLET